MNDNEWDDTPWAGSDVALTVSEPRFPGVAFRTLVAESAYGNDPATLSNLLAMMAGGQSNLWRQPTVREAMSVPAIFRSVTLIANTVGSLRMEVFDNGALMDAVSEPRIVNRPDPFRLARDFYRDTAHHLATRGEYWWWVAKRDPFDNSPMSLIVVPPWEVTVDLENGDRLRPRITWNGTVMPNADMRHGTYLLDDSCLRGVGPLQMCGAAVSVAVESQEWAANFFGSGGYPSVLIRASGVLGEDPETGASEAEILRSQFMNKPHNTPRVVDESIESVEEFGVNPQAQAMLSAREFETGDSARMFGIPGALLEYATPGSSLTYQNVESVFTTFVRTCLTPNYLEPIEHEMSDLLARSKASRFNVSGLLRADIRTRYDVHKIAIDAGIYDANHAAQIEGIAPGNTEYAATPPAPPSAVPTALPTPSVVSPGPIQPYLNAPPTNAAPVQVYRTAPESFRCDGRRIRNGILVRCDKLLAANWQGACPRCKRLYAAEVAELRTEAAGHEVRCPCGKLLAEIATAPYRFTCPRCKTPVAA